MDGKILIIANNVNEQSVVVVWTEVSSKFMRWLKLSDDDFEMKKHEEDPKFVEIEQQKLSEMSVKSQWFSKFPLMTSSSYHFCF